MENEKKEKSLGFRWVMAGCIFLLVMGVFLFVCSLVLGDNWFIPPGARAL